ncbi:MAG: RagB/SusD family nutrient uptake outer membrane protein [Phocaeicola sp.]
MNKIFLTLGLVATIFCSSCSDFLDRTPSTSLPDDEAITSLFDLQNAVNGIGYLMTRDRMTYSAEMAIYADIKGNDFAVIRGNGYSEPISTYNINKNHELSELPYQVFYRALASVNRAIESADHVQHTAAEAAKVNNLKGQLLAWRGMLHFDLARYYCQIPTIAADVNAANTGLALSIQSYLPSYKPTRTTLKETYDQIIADFTDALPLLEQANSANGYISYWGALALRSRAYLYTGEDALAKADADKVINEGRFRLYTMDNYATVWSQEYTDESIFELQITNIYNAQRTSAGFYTDATGYAECGFNTTGELYTYLTSNPNDVRSLLIKDQTDAAVYGRSAGYYPDKYPGRDGNIYVNNPKIVRLSEMYLIAAEAASHQGDNATAANYINQIRKNRIADYQDVATVTLEDILFEYRVEFFAENQSSFAYWRNKQSVKNMVGQEVTYNDPLIILPIPQREIDLIGPGLVQNPGY